jgi:hypothetical protein
MPAVETDPRAENRLRVLFALQAVPPRLISDVLADGTIVARFQIPATRPIKLSDTRTISRADLFGAFAAAAAGDAPVVSVREGMSSVEGSVRIEADGSAVLEVPNHRWRFAYAGLMAQDPEQRRKILLQALDSHTLGLSSRERLWTIVAQAPFTEDAFVEATEILASSPESFAREFKERLSTREVGESDLLPEDPRHWDNLSAAIVRSQTLAEFIGSELAEERAARLTGEPASGLRMIALTFAAPELVPHQQLATLGADALLRAVEALVQVDDHFALVGAFEICARWAPNDARFVPVAEQALQRLFGDIEQLRVRCTMFAVAFMLATARLALHSTTRAQPVFWRRLCAASHASLIVRTNRGSTVDRKGLFQWASRIRGREFLLSAYQDMATEARWRPEWLDSGILVADAFGRVISASPQVSKGDMPSSWAEKIAAAKAWIDEQGLWFPAQYPSVLQGALAPPTPDEDLKDRITDVVRRLLDEPTATNLARLTPFVEILGAPPGATDGVRKSLLEIQRGTKGFEDDTIQTALSTAARTAVLARDVSLAEVVANTCFDKARSLASTDRIPEAVLRLLECAAADADRKRARATLANRLERLAFMIPVGPFALELTAMLEILQRLDPDLAPLLGRAIHAARLAVPRA